MTRYAPIAACLLLLGASVRGQSQDGSTEPVPIDPAADPVNRLVAAKTVSGLIVALRIEGSGIELDRTQPARIPRSRRKATATGDTVTVTGLNGGTPVAAVTVPDPTVIVMEGRGLARPERRTIHVALPTPRAIDAIEVRVSASGATARFDVRPAYEEICRFLPRDPMCEGKAGEPGR